MLGFIFCFALAVVGIFYLILYPVAIYIKDAKGLRKYPNLNKFSGITDLGFVYEAHKGFRSRELLKAHQEHEIVRIGPNSLSFGPTAAIKDIYGHGTKCTKDAFYVILSGSHPHLADVVDKSEHARKRKVLSSAYAIKNLEGWEHKVADKAERFIKAFDTYCSENFGKDQQRSWSDEPVNYREYANFFSIDAVADIGLSERLGFLDQAGDQCIAERPDGTLHNVSYREVLHKTAHAQSRLVWAYDWYPTLRNISKLVSRRYRNMWAVSKSWDDIVLHLASQRMKRYQAGEKLDDFFTALMDDKKGNPNNLEWGEIVAEISIMMNAGSDTTAIAMNNAMFHLLSHPSALERLRVEVDSVLDPSDVVAPYDKIKHLPYLRACLDEALRITPPVTFGLPRRTPAEGASILGRFIPGDTSVSMSAYVAHRDESVFVEPEVFNPQRWLGDGGKDLQTYFITFSAGARSCIGRNISYLEQSVLLASVIHRYEFELPYEGWQQSRVECLNLMPGPLPLKVRRRVFNEGLEE